MFRGDSRGEGGGVRQSGGLDLLHDFGETRLVADWLVGFREAVVGFSGFWDRDNLGYFPVGRCDRIL